MRDRFEAVPANAGKVIYNDALADPTSFHRWWIEIRRVIEGCRQGQASLYRIDVAYEVGSTAGQSVRDRYSDKCTDKADEFLELVIPDNDRGFRIYDYAVPASPTITTWYARVINEVGAFGEPNSRVTLFDPDKGITHVLMDLSVWHAVDLIRLPIYR